MTMHVRYATKEDIDRWFQQAAPGTMRAVVVEDGGQLLGVAGLVRMGDHIQCFSSILDRLRPHKRALVKAARLVQQMVHEVNGPVFAVCSSSEPTAPGLLRALGFQPYQQEVWRHG